MALPSAQLGQMTTLNIPSAIPNQQRGPKLWEQALAQVLTTAAAEGTKGVIGNVTDRDYSPQLNKEKATGWERLLHGPRTSEADYRQVIAERGDTERQGTQIKAYRDEGEASRTQAKTLAELERSGRTADAQAGRDLQIQLEKNRIQADAERQALADVARAGTETRGAMRDVSMQAERLAAGAENQAAETARTKAQTEQIQFLQNLIDPDGKIRGIQRPGGGGTGGGGPTVPAAAPAAPSDYSPAKTFSENTGKVADFGSGLADTYKDNMRRLSDFVNVGKVPDRSAAVTPAQTAEAAARASVADQIPPEYQAIFKRLQSAGPRIPDEQLKPAARYVGTISPSTSDIRQATNPRDQFALLMSKYIRENYDQGVIP